jgi:hypothetical protein
MAKIDRGEDNGRPREGDRKLSAYDRMLMAALGESRTVGLDTDPARTDFPELWRWLSQTEGGKDHIVQPAVLTLQLGPEGVLITLTHRDFKTSCPASCPHLGDALAAMEAVLNTANPPFKTWGKDPQVHLKKRRPK